MAASGFGTWLKSLRDQRGLSLRDLAQLSGVDHAYIHRLETGVKEAPSDQVVAKLISNLGQTRRNSDILRFLADHPNVDASLLAFVQADENVTFDEFHMLTTVVNRGAKPDYATSLARIRRFMRE